MQTGFERDEHHLILAGVVGLIFKILWDWLINRGKAKQSNGHMARIEFVLSEMNERQKKMWEHLLGHGKR